MEKADLPTIEAILRLALPEKQPELPLQPGFLRPVWRKSRFYITSHI
jgi:hypothetical protein